MAIKDPQARGILAVVPYLDHGFTWYRVIVLVLAIIVIFGIRYGAIIIPQVRSTADKVANLNNLQVVDIHGRIGGCIPLNINGTV